MRAISYVRIQDDLKAGASVRLSCDEKVTLPCLRMFDKEIRRVASIAKDAYVVAGESDYNSWFFADFNVCGKYLVLSYGKWEDGQYYWNLQHNTDVDGPEGIVDLKRSKLSGVVLRYLSNMATPA